MVPMLDGNLERNVSLLTRIHWVQERRGRFLGGRLGLYVLLHLPGGATLYIDTTLRNQCILSI
jgi:hypothetical protein